MAAAQRTSILLPMVFTVVTALMAVRQFAARLAAIAIRVTTQISVIEAAHGVHTPYTMERDFKVCEPITIGTADMLTGVLEGVTQSTHEAVMRIFPEIV
jgi:hypothetical protein